MVTHFCFPSFRFYVKKMGTKENDLYHDSTLALIANPNTKNVQCFCESKFSFILICKCLQELFPCGVRAVVADYFHTTKCINYALPLFNMQMFQTDMQARHINETNKDELEFYEFSFVDLPLNSNVLICGESTKTRTLMYYMVYRMRTKIYSCVLFEDATEVCLRWRWNVSDK